ncbi:MAG TPA: glycosyltransferase family 2 protein [Vicinamibacterales bacterium]
MTPAVTAIIVNYNAGAELRRALQSITDDLGERPWDAVVVDNASVDGSAEIVQAFPHAMLVRNAQNVGFGCGVNKALALARAPMVLIMNPDCRLEPGAVASLAAELERHPGCAIVGPRILDPDGTEQGSARGDPDMLTGIFGRSTRLRRWLPGLGVSARNVVLAGTIREGESLAVDWLSGACMLAWTDGLRSVGGFDERYFLYWEDADLCRRLRNAGSHVRYVPSAIAVHRVGHSSRTAPASSIKSFHAGAYLYYATHVAPGPLNPKRLLARALLAVRCWWRLRRA